MSGAQFSKGTLRSRPTSTLLIMGDHPSQILELSSDSSVSTTEQAPSPSPIPGRTPRRPSQMPKGLIRREAACSPAPSLVSLPAVTNPSPWKKLRRVHSDRFDQVEYERSVAPLLDEPHSGGPSGADNVETEEQCHTDANDVSWYTPAVRGAEILLQDEEARVVRRMIDRTTLIEELLRDKPAPSQAVVRSSPQQSRFFPRRNIAVSRPPKLSTIPSSRFSVCNATPARASDPPSGLVANSASTRTSTTPSSSKLVTPILSSPEHSEEDPDTGRCDACDRHQISGRKMRMSPCAHIVCSICFSSSISAVSVTHGPSRCTTCLALVESFEPVRRFNTHEQAVSSTAELMVDMPLPKLLSFQMPSAVASAALTSGTAVLRIDNVAWDITPAVVTAFLPSDVLPFDHVSPVHVLLDRLDGRTKDYLFVEVESHQAARLVLQTRQNALMPCGPASGGRKRFVTVSLASRKEMLEELRPKSAVELHSLLLLCQAAITAPPIAPHQQGAIVGYNGIAHFVKSRHGPFYALLSILCHVRGKKSPAYWDLFHVTSGAIAALSNALMRDSDPSGEADRSMRLGDEDLLDKVRCLFKSRFSLTPDGSPR